MFSKDLLKLHAKETICSGDWVIITRQTFQSGSKIVWKHQVFKVTSDYDFTTVDVRKLSTQLERSLKAFGLQFVVIANAHKRRDGWYIGNRPVVIEQEGGYTYSYAS
jgi:hypothetical protein